MILLLPLSVFAKDICDSSDIEIQSIHLENNTGNIEELSNPSISNQIINLGLKMNVVGDAALYKIVLKNNSLEDYYFDDKSLNLDMESVNYDISFGDNTSLIKAGEEKIVYLKVSYKEQMDASNFDNGLYDGTQVMKLNVMSLENPYTGRFLGLLIFISLIIGFFVLYKDKKKTAYLLLMISFIIPFTVRATCKHSLEVNTNLVIDVREAVFLPGKEVNVKMKQLAGNDLSTNPNGYAFKDQIITAIKYSDVEPDDINKGNQNIVSTPESGYPIYMWFDNGTIYWWSEDKTPALNEDASAMFLEFNKMKDISGLEKFDLTKSTNLNIFFANSLISDITPLSKWNTSSVQILSSMFFGTTIIDLISLKDWDVSNVTNMRYLFAGAPIVTLDGLENWNTSNVENMGYVFMRCSKLQDMKAIKNWNVSRVTNINSLFDSCFALEEIDLSNWDISNVTSMHSVFGMWEYDGSPKLSSSLKRIFLSDKFNTSKVTTFSGFVANNTSIEDYSFLKYLDVSNCKTMYTFLQYNHNFKQEDLQYMKDYDVSNVETMSYLFFEVPITSLKPIENWDVSKAKAMNLMFYGTRISSLSGLENWDVSSVEDMEGMFYNSGSITDASAINDWDITNVTNFTNMFKGVSVHPEFTKVNGTWGANGIFIPTE